MNQQEHDIANIYYTLKYTKNRYMDKEIIYGHKLTIEKNECMSLRNKWKLEIVMLYKQARLIKYYIFSLI